MAKMITDNIEGLYNTLENIERNGLQKLEPIYRQRVQSINDGNFASETMKVQDRLSKPSLKQRLYLSQASLIGISSYTSFVFISLLKLQVYTTTLHGYIYAAIDTAVDYVEENSRCLDEEVFERVLGLLDSCSQAISGVVAQSREVTYTIQMTSAAIQTYERLVSFLIGLIVCMSSAPLESISSSKWKKVQSCHQYFLDSTAQMEAEISKQVTLTHSHVSSQVNFVPKLSKNDISTTITPLVKLPNKNPRFCGRDVVLSDMREILGANDGSLTGSVTLQGLGGIGKTSIALHYAYTEAARYDVVLWMYSQTAIALAQSSTEAALKLQLKGSSGNAHFENRELLKNWFRNTKCKWLVVFDNAEDDKLLGEYYPNDQDGTIIVTTRKPNFGYNLTAAEIQISPFLEHEGKEALLKMATWNRSVPKDEDSAALMNRLLGGLPLGISQIAAVIRNKKISIKRFLVIYEEDKKRWHNQNPRGGHHADYDQNLNSVWNVSFKFLAEHVDAKIVLGILSFLSPDSIPQALFSQWEKDRRRPRTLVLPFCQHFADFIQVQEDLLNDGLVDVDSETGAFTLHRLVQVQFEYYMDPEECQKAFDNTTRLLLDAWPQAYSGLRVSDQWPQCQMYVQHVLNLNEHYLKEAKTGEKKYKGSAEFAELMSHVGWYLFEVSDFNHLRRTLDGGLQACEEIYDKPSEHIIWAFLHHIAGTAEEGKGNFTESKKFLLLAEKSRRSRENTAHIIEDDLVATVNNLGLVYNSLNQFEDGKKCFLECVKLLKQRPQTSDRDMTIVMSNHNIARCTMQAGDLEEARPLLEAQHSFYLASTNWWMLSNSYFVLGNYHWAIGNLQLANQHYVKAKCLLEENNAGKHPLTAANIYKLGRLAFYKAMNDAPPTNIPDISALSLQVSRLADQKLVEEAIALFEKALAILVLHPAIPAEAARVHYMLSKAIQQRVSPGKPSNGSKHASAHEATRLIESHCARSGMHMQSNMEEIDYDNFVSVKTR